MKRAVVETMGYADEGYRERKARLHPEMQEAADAASVIEHDFQMPAYIGSRSGATSSSGVNFGSQLGTPKNEQ